MPQDLTPRRVPVPQIGSVQSPYGQPVGTENPSVAAPVTGRVGPRNITPPSAQGNTAQPGFNFDQAARVAPPTPQPAPFTWDELQNRDSYVDLEPADQFAVTKRYYDLFVAQTGQSFDAWQEETAPSMGRMFVGASLGALADLQESTGLAAGTLGLGDTEKSMRQSAARNRKYAAQSAYRSKYGESGWEQIKNLTEPGWWKAVLAEMGPGSVPFMAGAVGGGVAGGTIAGPPGILIGSIIGGGGAVLFQEVGPAYYEFLDKYPGDTEGATEYAIVKSGLTAVLNAASVPLGFVGQSLGPLKHMLVQMAVQGVVGAADTASGNAVVKDLLDPTQDLSEGALKSFLGEAIFEAPGVTEIARRARQVRKQNALNAKQVRGVPLEDGMPDAPNPGPAGNTPPPAPPAAGAESVQMPDAPNPEPAAASGGAAAAEPQVSFTAPGVAPSRGEMEAAPSPPEDVARSHSTPTPEEVAAQEPAPPPAPPGPPRTPDQQAHDAATSPFNDTPEPTPAQIEAGNYEKGHLRVQGLDVSIENPAGSLRSGTNKDGTPWKNVIDAHYGYLRRSTGADGEQVDVFVGPKPDEKMAYVIDQVDPATGKFDEHKVMLGFPTIGDARAAYQKSYEPGWLGLGAITPVSVDNLKTWLAKGNRTHRKPFGDLAGNQAADAAERTAPPTPTDAQSEAPVSPADVQAPEPPVTLNLRGMPPIQGAGPAIEGIDAQSNGPVPPAGAQAQDLPAPPPVETSSQVEKPEPAPPKRPQVPQTPPMEGMGPLGMAPPAEEGAEPKGMTPLFPSQPRPVETPSDYETGKPRPHRAGQTSTVTGRSVPVPPELDQSTGRRLKKSVKAYQEWLRQQAIDEAQSRGDGMTQRLFTSAEAGHLTVADQDMMNQYVFGEESPQWERRETFPRVEEVPIPETMLNPWVDRPKQAQPAGDTMEESEVDDGEPAAAAEPAEPGGELREGVSEKPEGQQPADAEGPAGEGEAVATSRSDSEERGGNGSGDAGAGETTEEPGGELRPEAGDRGDRDEGPAAGDRPERVEAKPTLQNYHITDEDNLGEGGPVAKYNDNIAAIKLLKELEADGRLATPEEQKVLARYVGWGGLPAVFNTWEAREDRQAWTRRGEEVRALLAPEEYAAARASTLNAHYTSRQVIQAIYSVLDKLGFEHGQILEPAAGTGNFLGIQPKARASRSKWTAIELDPLTGRIAKQLYPQSRVLVQGLQDANLPPNFYDLAVSNVPFDDATKLEYEGKKHRLHNYFFLKSLEHVRPGGLVAFITTAGTMDAMGNQPARLAIRNKADLVVAFRLPSIAFKANALTEVTTDLIILQKREDGAAPNPNAPAWLDTKDMQPSAGGLPVKVNEYYHEHPDHLLGRIEVDKLHPGRAGLVANNAVEYVADLVSMADKVPSGVYEAATRRAPTVNTDEQVLDALTSAKEGSFLVEKGKIFRSEDGRKVPYRVGDTVAARIKGLVGIRDQIREVFRTQIAGDDEKAMKAARDELNKRYDAFVKKEGPINGTGPTRAFRDDPDWSLVSSIEHYDTDKKTAGKADIFRERTIDRIKPVEKVESAQDGLMVSLNERGVVDLDHIAKLSGRDVNTVLQELGDQVFHDPQAQTYEAADAYLSGRVREKLAAAKLAAKRDPAYQRNVDALEKVQPVDVEPAGITVRLGAPWMPTADLETFASDVLGVRARVSHHVGTADWRVSLDTRAGILSAANTDEYGTENFRGDEMMEKALNQQRPVVMKWIVDENGNDKKVKDMPATTAARAKQDALEERFSEWIWEDAERAVRLARLYNVEQNNLAGREWDGSHLTFPGMNPAIRAKLHPHQKNAIWRMVQQLNTLIAHAVGAGKTWAMAAAAMERKRLGLSKKSMFVVPNHMIEQWAREFRELYPTANILAAGRKDFEGKKRKRLFSRIATGNWDAVIVAHSSFGKIPAPLDHVRDMVHQEIDEFSSLVIQMKGDKADNRLVKQLEKTRKKLEQKYTDMENRQRADDLLDFGEMGIDTLFVDEAHEFKNLTINTKMQRVPGTGTKQSVPKTFSMFTKASYVQKINRGGGVIFATATPITNSMAEMYVMQKYLQPAELKARGIYAFDAWAAAYGKVEEAMELTPEGNGFRGKERFRKFINLPEMVQMFRAFSDVLTDEDMDKGGFVTRPKVKGGKSHVISVPINEDQQAIKEELVKRAKDFRANPSADKAAMLMVSQLGRQSAMDPRIVWPHLGEQVGTKLDVAANNVAKIWKETADRKAAQLVFIDFSVPSTKEGKFSAYQWMRDKLVSLGIPEREIAFIHDHDDDASKGALFKAVRSGDVRVLLGSTPKMGQGTNVQTRLYALHHIDPPWRPDAITQRDGRIVRQGNMHSEVELFTYVTEESFDAYMWQTLKRKAEFISQAMKGDVSMREADDIDESVMNAAEIMAVASGDPRIMEKANLDMEVAKLRTLKSQHRNQIFRVQQRMATLPGEIRGLQSTVKAYKEDIAQRVDTKGDAFKIVLQGQEYTVRKEAAEALKVAVDSLKGTDGEHRIGNFAGFPLYVSTSNRYASLAGAHGHRSNFDLGTVTGEGLLQSLETRARNMEQGLARYEEELAAKQKYLADTEKEAKRPFPQEKELAEKEARLEELMGDLKLEEKTDIVLEDEDLADDSTEDDDTQESRSLVGASLEIDLEAMQAEAERMLGEHAPELRVVKELFGGGGRPIPGSYAGKIVRLAEWAADPKRTLNHELFHAAYELLSPDMRTRLDAQMAAERPMAQNVAAALRRAGLADAATHALSDPKEAAAYAFELHVRGRENFPGMIQHIFGRLTAALRRIYRAVTGSGEISVNDLFDALYEGRLQDFTETPMEAADTPRSGREQAVNRPRESRGAVGTDQEMRPEGPRKLLDKLANIPFRLIPVHKAYGAVMDRLIDRVPERMKAGLWDRYGETDEMKGARLRLKYAQAEGVRTTRNAVERLMGLDLLQSQVAYQWMTTNDPVAETELMAQLPEKEAAVLRELKQTVHDLGKEAVDLGLVTPDAFQRNAMAYLRRSYRNHELTEKGDLEARRRRATKILGDNLKGRGMSDDYKRSRLAGDAGAEWWEANSERLKGQKFQRVERRARGEADGRLLTYAYIPEDNAIPERFLGKGWLVDADESGKPNLWEARWNGKSAAEIKMWRDFSKAERENLGEIEEVKYAVMRTLSGMLRDIESARYFKHIAEHPEWTVNDAAEIPDGGVAAQDAGRLKAYLPNEWVKVPDSRIPRTPQVKVYGQLAGRWVQAPIWNEIRRIGQWETLDRWKWFEGLARMFKISKTALSPTTHANNTMSNFVFAEWADIRASSVLKSMQTYLDAWRGDDAARKALEDFQVSGAGYGTYATMELREELLEPLRKMIADEAGQTGVEAPDGHALSGVRALAAVDAVVQGLKGIKDFSVDLYQFEDNVFRLAAYQQHMAEGASSQEAAAKATDAFLDYDINAPWVNVARQTALPFIAFSYRAIPKLHQLAKEKPYKLLKMALVMGALNAATYAFLGADEEEERRLLPEERQGRVLGLFPRMVRMPWNHGKDPVFLDAVRWVPAGDLFLWQDTRTAIPILPFMVPGGPLEWGMEFLANKDFYTGEPITKETDTPMEKGKKVALHLWKGIAPSAVVVPGSYAYDKVFPSFPEQVRDALEYAGLGSETPTLDPFGREYPALIATLNAFGFKIGAFPKDVAQMRYMQRANAQIQEISQDLHRARAKYIRGGISEKELRARILKAQEKIRSLQVELQNRLRPRDKSPRAE